MKINFHIEAIKNYNERVNELLLFLTPKKEAIKRTIVDTGIIIKDISNEVIQHKRGGEVDYTGMPVSIFFKWGAKEIGLFKDNFISLVKIAEDIQKSASLYEIANVAYIYDKIFEWMELKYLGQAEGEMMYYFIQKIEKDIHNYEIWVPIAHTIIEDEFQIGIVKVISLSKEIFNQWESGLIKIAKDESHRNRIIESMAKERREKQGYAVAVVNIQSEAKRAEEIAYEKVEEALGLLRILSPAAGLINHISYTTIKGQENIEKCECYFIEDGYIKTQSISLLKFQEIDWIIRKDFIEQIKHHGLNLFNELLLNKNRNPFQETVLRSIGLFSRSTLMKNIPDKLVYIFASLESILIKNENEPIQTNLSDRIAFAIGNDGKVRQNIVNNIKEAYKFRSKFVHHGIRTNEIGVLNEFLWNSTKFFYSVLENINIFETKEDMINALEKRKYGG